MRYIRVINKTDSWFLSLIANYYLPLRRQDLHKFSMIQRGRAFSNPRWTNKHFSIKFISIVLNTRNGKKKLNPHLCLYDSHAARYREL